MVEVAIRAVDIMPLISNEDKSITFVGGHPPTSGGSGGGFMDTLTEGPIALVGLGLLIVGIVIVVWVVYRKLLPYLGIAEEFKEKREAKEGVKERERALAEREERELKAFHLRRLTQQLPQGVPFRMQEEMAQAGRIVGVQRARDIEMDMELDAARI